MDEPVGERGQRYRFVLDFSRVPPASRSDPDGVSRTGGGETAPERIVFPRRFFARLSVGNTVVPEVSPASMFELDAIGRDNRDLRKESRVLLARVSLLIQRTSHGETVGAARSLYRSFHFLLFRFSVPFSLSPLRLRLNRLAVVPVTYTRATDKNRY